MPRHSSGGGPSGSGKPLRGHPKDSPEVRLSKTLSWILRHGAKSEGLYMRTDGYVRVSDLVRVEITIQSAKSHETLECDSWLRPDYRRSSTSPAYSA